MRYLSWFGKKARTGRTLLLSVTLLAGVALSGALVPASAQAAQAHIASSGRTSHLVVSQHSLVPNVTDPCNPIPAGDFCVGSDFNSSGNYCTGLIVYIPTADFHSAWFKFINVPGFNVRCIENPTNSSIWVEDEADEGQILPHCAKPGTGIGATGYVWTIFFVKYNVKTCGSEPDPGNEP